MNLDHLARVTLAFLVGLPLLSASGAANGASSSADAVSLRRELTDLAAASDVIVVGRVATIQGRRKGASAVTRMVLDVTETLRGVPHKKIALDLDRKNAKRDQEQSTLLPPLVRGDEVAAFLARQPDGTLKIVGGQGHGLSRVRREAPGGPILVGGVADGLALSDLASLKGGAATKDAAAGGTAGVAPVASDSGIEGEVMIGPTKPSHRIGSPPDVAPYKTILVVEATPSGREVARVKSGPDGRFRIALPAGDYIVRPAAPETLLPRAEPVEVKVLPGQFAHVTVNFDSGMR